MRFILVGLLFVHGALHFLGFRGRVQGVPWLVAGLGLVAAGVMLLVGRERWWLVAALAVVMSQILIITAWPAAKAGTIVNVLLAIPVLLAASQWRFERQTRAEVSRLLAAVPARTPAIVDERELVALPPPVRKWLVASGVVGRERTRVVRLAQRGALRTGADQPWMPAQAEQHFTVDAPGFVWSVEVTMKGFPYVVGRDSYLDGRGHMLIAIAGLVPVVNASGDKIDQGTLLRFLGELVWFPSAALAPYIRWEPIDATSAKATMTYGGVSAAAVFTFDEAGRMLRLEANRYKDSGPDARLERWQVAASAWRRMAGVLMPVEGNVSWKLSTGDLEVYRWEIIRVEHNPPQALRSARPVASLAASIVGARP